VSAKPIDPRPERGGADWFALTVEVSAVTAEVARKYRPAQEAKTAETLAKTVTARLASRKAELERGVDRKDFRRLVALVAEHELGEGGALAQEVKRVVKDVGKVSSDDVDDLVADVLETLLQREQKELRYILDVAASMKDFDGLVGMHTGRRRSGRRRRTVRDNLRDRIRQLLNEPTYVEIGRFGNHPAYGLAGEARELVPVRRREIVAATGLAWSVPRLAAGDGERASMVYTTDSLSQILLIVARTVPGAFTIDDILDVLSPILAEYLPIDLYDGDKIESIPGSRLQPGQEVVAREAADRILDGLAGEARAVVALALLETKKIDIAPLLGRTRPTIDRRLEEEARPVFESALSGLAPAVTACALELVSAELTREALVTACTGLLRGEPFVKVGEVDRVPLYSATDGREIARPTAEEIDSVARDLVLSRTSHGEIYSPEWLREALAAVAAALDGPFSAEDAVEIVQRSLTGSDGTEPDRDD
jgi:hypothetical protein